MPAQAVWLAGLSELSDAGAVDAGLAEQLAPVLARMRVDEPKAGGFDALLLQALAGAATQRVTLLDSSPDKAVPALWQARLDLATTLVLMRDPAAAAAAALVLAANARPPKMPKNHPLDAVQRYLEWVDQGAGKQTAKPALPRHLSGIF